MVTGIIGKKSRHDAAVRRGRDASQPATVLKAGPCVVVAGKTAQTDGYEAVQLGLVEAKPPKVNKADRRPLQEGQRAADARAARGEASPRAARRRRPATRCCVVDLRRRRARRRHRHQPRQGLPGRRQAPPLRAAARRRTARCSTARPARSAPRRIPSRVVKGMRMAGHMGADRVTVRNLKVCGSTPRTTCCSSRARCPARPAATW